MKLHTSVAVRAGLLVLAPAVLCACKGRTAENMVPSGDTVEVVISTPDSAPEVPAPEITAPEIDAADSSAL